MELILKTNNKESIAKLIALAKKLNVIVEKKNIDNNSDTKEAIKDRILKFRATSATSFGDAEKWQKEQRADRDLPFT